MEKEEKNHGMLCHLLSLCGYSVIPMGHIVGPLVIWLLKREDSEFVDQCGKDSLNFQISMTIWIFFAALLCIILIGIPILFGLVIVNFYCVIKAAIAADKGKTYTYPLSLRLLK